MSEHLDITSVVNTNEYFSDINRKEIPIGTVVYYLDTDRYSNGRKVIKYGIVEEHYHSSIALQLLDKPDMRYIRGVPVKDFVTPTHWEKLPKGWTYDTQLFEIEEKPMPKSKEEIDAHIDISKPENILWLYENGCLVKVQDNSYREFMAEIDKHKGWRIVEDISCYYQPGKYKPSYVSVSFHNVYLTYEDAQKALEEDYAEYRHQAEMSEYDWSVYLIDRELDRWASIYGGTDIEKKKYRDWILTQDNVEDIEIKIERGGIAWKYLKNQKWRKIVI